MLEINSVIHVCRLFSKRLARFAVRLLQALLQFIAAVRLTHPSSLNRLREQRSPCISKHFSKTVSSLLTEREL